MTSQTDTRNDRTRDALDSLGRVLAFYVTGDMNHDEIAQHLASATWEALDDDFGPAVRRQDVATALRSLSDALAAEAEVQQGMAR